MSRIDLSDSIESIKANMYDMLYRDPSLILVIKDRYIDDEMWKFCISLDPDLFQEMKHPSQDVAEFAVTVDGCNLQYIVNRFTHIKITAKMVFNAVQNCALAILYVPESFMSHGLKEIAFDKNPSLMQYFSYDEIRREYLEKKIEENVSNIKYIQNPPESLICRLIEKNPYVCSFLPEITPKMREVMEEFHPSYLELYDGAKQNELDINRENND